MGTVAFSTVTHQILYRHGHIGPDTYRTAGTTVFPGSVVVTNSTLTKTVKLCVDDAITTGIAGLIPNHDIDTAYAAGVAIPVYTVNSGAIVWARFKKNLDAVSGQPLNHDGSTTTGCVFPGEGGIDEYVGVAYRDIDVVAADETPGLVQLVQS